MAMSSSPMRSQHAQQRRRQRARCHAQGRVEEEMALGVAEGFFERPRIKSASARRRVLQPGLRHPGLRHRAGRTNSTLASSRLLAAALSSFAVIVFIDGEVSETEQSLGHWVIEPDTRSSARHQQNLNISQSGDELYRCRPLPYKPR